MKLQEMEQLLPKFEEELIVAKEFMCEENPGMLLAVTRQDKAMAFWVLTAGKKPGRTSAKKKTVTNRTVMLEAIEDSKIHWYEQVEAVKARDKEMKISNTEVLFPEAMKWGNLFSHTF